MKRKNVTRNALFTSIISLLLCVSMLVGTTFAWFTDEVTSANNIIKSGNLDVELYYQAEGQNDWTKVDANSNIFKENTLWEPGHTEVVKLKVVNEGTLALKYQLGVNVASETGSVNMAGKDFLLSDYIKFGVVDGAQTYTREQAVAAVEQSATALNVAYTVPTAELPAASANATTAANEAVVTMVVYMPTSVGNEANYGKGAAVPTINLGINLFATQLAAESDSFGPDYDDNIWADAMVVVSEDDLLSALAAGETEIKLEADIALTKALEIPANTNLTLNLNGKTLSSDVGTDEEGNRVHVLKNLGSLTLVGGTVSSNGTNAGSAVYNEGTATIEGTKFNGAPFGSSGNPSYVFNNNGGTMTITNAEIEAQHGVFCAYNNGVTTVNNTTATMGLNGKTHHVFYTYSGGAITVNGGTYTNKATDQNDTGGSCINGVVTTNAGTFNGRLENYYGNPVLQGGTFSVNPNANFIAAGYKAIDNNGKYVVVPEDTDSVVTTAADLADAIAQGGVVSVMADIDMNNAWTSVVPANGLVIEGNDHVISNLNLPLMAGKGGPVVTVKGLTIANSNVGIAANENGLGTGAFIAFADHSGTLVFEDCHMVNSTVTGNERAAAFVGYSYANVTIKDCSVDKCTITAVGSTAALIGHANGVTTIEKTSVTNTKVTATEDRLGTKAALAGAVIGTVSGDTTLTKVTVSGNTVSNNNALPAYNDCIGRKVAGTLVVDGKTAASSAADIAAGGEFVLTGDIQSSSPINNNTTIDLSGNTFEATSSYNLSNNADFTMTNGDYVVNKTYGHIDVRPTSAEGSVVTFENVDFTSNYKNKTFGTCTDRLVSVLETAPKAGAKVVAVFKNCTFDNAKVLIEGLSEGAGLFDVTFENCTFNALTSSAPIEVMNYMKGTITVKNCTFNLTCTSASASAIAISPSSSTEVTVVAENNTINATAATAHTYDPTAGETEVDTIKVHGTPANIKFISADANATITETNTVKTGIAA